MSLILLSAMLPYWLVMEIENLLGWEHTLKINNQLIKHNIATIFIWLLSCSQHSDISKRVGKGVFTICVVLDQSTVIFQKGGEVLQFVWY
jgi:uncharacterized protein YacL